MSEDGDIAFAARLSMAVVEDLIERARKLRKKAEELERASERFGAAAARDLAEYLESVAADCRGP